MPIFSVTLPPEVDALLGAVSTVTGKSRANIVREAIRTSILNPDRTAEAAAKADEHIRRLEKAQEVLLRYPTLPPSAPIRVGRPKKAR